MVYQFLRRNLRFILTITAAAFLLRLMFIRYFPGVVTDSFVYGDIAKNWLQHGVYGLSGPEEISPTYIRLPGYPAFLALIFSIFGMEHYRAVLIVQMFLDVGACFVCADIALRIFGPASARTAFVLAALCPFLANYSAAALTETLEVFFTALALDLTARALQTSRAAYWAGCGAACAAAILLRPDGMLLVVAIEAFLVWKFAAKRSVNRLPVRIFLIPVLLVGVVSTLPLVPWTLRNWRVFHRFQPLAPRYANEEEEFVPMGFNHWVKTWIADYSSVEEIYWAVPGSEMDPGKLPSRAFDSLQQQAQTAGVIKEYNTLLHVSPELDRRFEAIASDRIRAHPARYYLGLPALRVLDMWARPRTEMLPSDSRWWEFNDEPKFSALAVSLGMINVCYLVLALAGWVRTRRTPLVGLLITFCIFRSAFLGTLENPEPRYTLEMYPVVILLGAATIAGNRALAQGRVSHAEARSDVL